MSICFQLRVALDPNIATVIGLERIGHNHHLGSDVWPIMTIIPIEAKEIEYG
ncbi:MAG: hypothetical protein ACI91C_002564 [Burkholderiaceae bacterium]